MSNVLHLFMTDLKFPSCTAPYLHGGEVADVVELEDHLHITFGEALVAPAHVVVTGPSSVHVAVEEVVQTPAAVGQLAEAPGQSAGSR